MLVNEGEWRIEHKTLAKNQLSFIHRFRIHGNAPPKITEDN